MSLKSALGIRQHGHRGEQEDHWIPLSDLMTGLMMMFMLVAISFMIKVTDETKKHEEFVEQQAKFVEQQAKLTVKEADKVKTVVSDFDALRQRLYDRLDTEFKDDLPLWGAELDHDLTIRFKEPDVLFTTGDFKLKARFIKILDDFFPRYINILTAPEFRAAIEEVRIEGHTSSIWNNLISGDQAYFHNMELSQQRTRSTLEHVFSLSSITLQKTWLMAHLTANGLSSSKPRLNPDGTENPIASQRVEFRVRMNADAKLAQIRDQPVAAHP